MPTKEEIREARRELLRQNSALALPDNPSSSRWSAAQIKNLIAKGQFILLNLINELEDKTIDGDVENSLQAQINELNTLLETLSSYTIGDDYDSDDGSLQEQISDLASNVSDLESGKLNIVHFSSPQVTLKTIYDTYGSKPFIFTIGSVSPTYLGRVMLSFANYSMYAFEITFSSNTSAKYYLKTNQSTIYTLQDLLDSSNQHILVVKTDLDSVKNRVSYLESDYKDKKSEILDYTNHTNKPQINSVTLSGNKSWSDLGLTKAVLTGIIGAATDSADGYMSSTDHEKLTTLYALLGESADADSFVNTINEILAIFDEYPEGADLITALASKVSISDIVDNLTSQATNKPLSANQGYVLDGKIDFLGVGLTNLLNGTATSKKAQQDKDGNDIHSTYIKQSEKSSMEEEMEVNVLEELVGGEVTIFEGTEKEETTNFEDKIDECNEAIASINSKANVDGNYPTMAVGKSLVTKQIENVSENSGSTQEDPFIFQATGTNNNTSETPTSPVAKQLEKQGNSVVYNQQLNGFFNFNTYNSTASVSDGVATITNTSGTGVYYRPFNYVGSHKYWVSITCKQDEVGTLAFNDNYLTTKTLTTVVGSWVTVQFIITPSASATNPHFQLQKIGANGDKAYFKDCYLIDLAQWYGSNDNIPSYLLSHPEYFTNLYNGDYHYSTGGIDTSDGVTLETIGFNQWDEEWENGYINDQGQLVTDTNSIRSKNYNRCIPNATYYICGSGVRILWYDANQNFIDSEGGISNTTKVSPNNAVYFKVSLYNYGTTYKNDICINLSWDGQRDGTYESYIKRSYNTGTETLRSAGSAKDIKVPSGVITRKVGSVDLGSLSWTGDGTNRFYASLSGSINNFICAKYQKILASDYTNRSKIGMLIDSNNILVYDTSYDNATAFTTAMSGVMLNYELATPTTEQGTPFAENIEVDDYGTMAWLDGNGDYVEIPQGCKLFYPADYVLLVDDLNNYTDGDVTKLALKTDLASDKAELQNVDTILQNAIGGTLRQCLCVKESLDFDNTDVVDLGTLNWNYSSTYQRFECNIPIADMKKPATNSSPIKAISTIYEVSDANSSTNLTFAVNTSGELRIFDNTVNGNKDTLLAKLKGMLLAYEKASS